MLSTVILALPTLLLAQGNSFDSYSCDDAKCKLPLCKCASRDPPIQNPPQFLTLTFDDSPQTELMQAVYSLFPNNPNGCAAKGVWYSQAQDTNPYELQKWYANGHEVGDHSLDHDQATHSFAGSYAQIEGFRAFANAYAGIPLGKITGVRFPFLNYSVESLNMISKMGFTYDSSFSAGPASEHIWPYTMDQGVVTNCQGLINLCKNSALQAPGLWEIPMYSSNNALYLMDPYNMPTLKNPISGDELFNILKSEFDTHYAGNKAPFGIYMHATWIVPRPGASNNETLPDGAPKLATIKKFISYAMSRPDTWIVTNDQLIQYMRNPVIFSPNI